MQFAEINLGFDRVYCRPNFTLRTDRVHVSCGVLGDGQGDKLEQRGSILLWKPMMSESMGIVLPFRIILPMILVACDQGVGRIASNCVNSRRLIA